MKIDKAVLEKISDIIDSNENIEDILVEENDIRVLHQLTGLGDALLSWYEFDSKASILEIGSGCGRLTGLLLNRLDDVWAYEENTDTLSILEKRYSSNSNLHAVSSLSLIPDDKKFDYVTLIGCEINEETLAEAKSFLKPDGELIIAVNNEFSLRHWTGLPSFGPSISVNRLKSLLSQAEFYSQEFYYPYPDYIMPLQIFTPERLPYANEITNHTQNFVANQVIFHDQAYETAKLIENGLYEAYVNSFLVICSKEAKPGYKLLYSKQNYYRSPEYRIQTSIYNGESVSVSKKPIHSNAKTHIENMRDNYESLSKIYRTVKVTDCWKKNGIVYFPFVNGEALLSDLDVVHSSIDEIIAAVKKAMDVVFDYTCEGEPFEETKEFNEYYPGCHPRAGEISYPVTNIDSNFDNFIVDGDNIWCIDYEWVVDFKVPINYVKFRNLLYFYTKYVSVMGPMILEKDFYAAFGFSQEDVQIYRQMEECFQLNVHGDNRKYILSSKFEKPIRSYQDIIDENAASMNAQINELNNVIKAKDELISVRIKQIAEVANRFDAVIEAKDIVIAQLT